MVCQQCNQRSATVHFTKIEHGEKSEFHLCEPCARERGEFIYKGGSGFTIHNLLSGLLNLEQTSSGTAPSQLRCQTCGLTYGQFSQVGRFGCSDCYESFANRLEPLLRRVHGSTTHSGKVPSRVGCAIKAKKTLNQLRQLLQQKIQAEQFEEAAVLRDQIRDLEQSIELEG